jgi:hypothetical protein
MLATELHSRLRELHAERRTAAVEGLSAGGAYMADLDQEIAETTQAYVQAAVTEIAILRAELSGPPSG